VCNDIPLGFCRTGGYSAAIATNGQDLLQLRSN
jgi:hypothetical protein